MISEWIDQESSGEPRKALSEISLNRPRTAVLEIWDAAMVTLRLRREFPHDCTDQKLLILAEQGGVISADERSLLNYNRQIRNDCAHESDRVPTPDEFIAFFEEVGRTVWMPGDAEFTQARLALHR